MFHYYKQFFSIEKIEELKSKDLIVSGDKGGLLIGNSHAEEGIKMLFKRNNGYELLGEIEGDEYILNWESSIIHRKRLLKINNSNRDKKKKQKQNDISTITTIDCRTDKNPYTSKYLIFDSINSNFIINKFSTNIFLREIELLNTRNKIYPENEYLNNLALENIDLANRINKNKKRNLFERIFNINY